ncbi:ATP synthase F0 subunit A [Dysgonomonas sp. 216]|uniref:F0F1 ATP synthase subunit A n=1 Tax=Dysgonomonas sp. 216 TaxID=2302934 RepID=UPI0013D15820|nr:F0F1 ATP synthase subunit A [Dysgonomonas sp. 216]NDW19376.1 ATP synthase F0 subunit A [Dysgonomonas sp. 216]
MNYIKNIIVCMCLLVFCSVPQVMAGGNAASGESELDVKELILEHIGDAYEWHITTLNGKHISVPLPVIVKGENSGWNIFLSSHFHHGTEAHKGFYISQEEKYKGKIVEKNSAGEEVRPWDISITKNVASLLMASVLLVIIVLSVARWYKKRAAKGEMEAPKGFVGFMEMFIMNVNDDIIKPCVGKDYKRFAPYLLTAFFFIFLNNLLGLIPLFPGGANLTGNIAVTFVLALFTFIIVNVSGTKEYWKEIFWPEVPTWLKVPLPIMPVIELVGVFTKPFALMIRLFANILAGHSIVLGLTCLIFVTVGLGTAINYSMSFVSVLLSIFINLVELLVAYIQAYVFTMLSAVFIGLARVEPHHSKEH